jgi:hypothetical protein
MKSIKIVIFIITIATITNSCEKKLELTNPNQFTTDLFWKSDADFLNGLAAT